ncbi:hypothetical protein EYF80_048803 [Liparis tanakae]|uniref:Uncharacterized protein n=1 Tax=Liparis tanakae TaxID=230148 RepID=A0A4Z2FJS4_9TELE|nr:hypothetical protein EYF80_048803 [Liparis tanakae]
MFTKQQKKEKKTKRRTLRKDKKKRASEGAAHLTWRTLSVELVETPRRELTPKLRTSRAGHVVADWPNGGGAAIEVEAVSSARLSRYKSEFSDGPGALEAPSLMHTKSRISWTPYCSRCSAWRCIFSWDRTHAGIYTMQR